MECVNEESPEASQGLLIPAVFKVQCITTNFGFHLSGYPSVFFCQHTFHESVNIPVFLLSPANLSRLEKSFHLGQN